MKAWLEGVALLAVAVCATAPAAARDTVRVVALRDALDPAVLDRVGAAAGADILVDGFATAGEVEAALRAPAAAYDVALLPADAVGSRIRPDLLRPLDPGAVPEAAAVLPQLTAAIGPAAQVSMPFDWYPIGFAIDPAKLKDAGLPTDPAAGWDVLDRPDLLRRVEGCGFGWPEAARDAYQVAAAATAGTLAEALERRRVLALLTQLRLEARKGSAAERSDGLAGGDLCAAVLPAPDALLAAERARAGGAGPELGFVLPAGGGLLAVDVLALPVGSRNHGGALAVLRALLRPETVAANARATHVAPAVGRDAAEPAFDPATLGKLRLPQPLDAASERAGAAVWTRAPGR